MTKNFKDYDSVQEFCSNLIEYVEEHDAYSVEGHGKEITLEQLNEDIQDYMNIMLEELRRKK